MARAFQMHYNQGQDLFSYIKNKEVFEVSSGMVDTPNGPGLGIEIDEELVGKSAAESKDFSWRNPVWRGPDGGIREW